jgi:hypothetical protein
LAKPIRRTEKRVQVILEPEFARRKALMEEHGQDYPGKNVGSFCNSQLNYAYSMIIYQNDFLSWMMDAAQGNATRWDNHYVSIWVWYLAFVAYVLFSSRDVFSTSILLPSTLHRR